MINLRCLLPRILRQVVPFVIRVIVRRCRRVRIGLLALRRHWLRRLAARRDAGDIIRFRRTANGQRIRPNQWDAASTVKHNKTKSFQHYDFLD